MVWVRTVPEGEATGAVRERYRADLDSFGFVLEATKAFSLRPELSVAYGTLRAAIWSASGLTGRERNLIQFVVADRIHSTACVLFYGLALERELGGVQGLRAVLDDYRRAGLSEREVAILDYAVATADGHPEEAHVTRLRQFGLDDGAILDAAFTAAFRLFGSRLYGALGVETDPFLLEQTDLVNAVM